MKILRGLLRPTLIATVPGAGYVLVAMAILFPRRRRLYAARAAVLLGRNGKRVYAAHGTARRAPRRDLPHLPDGNGVILGTLMEGK